MFHGRSDSPPPAAADLSSSSGSSMSMSGGRRRDLDDGGAAADLSSDAPRDPTGELQQSLGFYDGLALVVGVIIGSGIFASPGAVLGESGSVGVAFLAWLTAGVLVLLGSLCFAEMGTCLPNAGGEYLYLQQAFGDWASFGFVWTTFFVIRTGSQTIISMIFARYLAGLLLGIDISGGLDDRVEVKALAIAAIVTLSLINCRGTRESAMVQKVFTVAKLVAIALVILVGLGALFTCSEACRDNFSNIFVSREIKGDTAAVKGAGFGEAMILALWAYDGWNTAAYAGEEMEDVRQLPKIVTVGVGSVLCIYLLTNLAYFAVLPFDVVISSEAIAMAMMETQLGPWAGQVVAFFVVLSTFGAVNGSTFVGGRTIYAAARDGLFPKFTAVINPRTHTPNNALFVQAVWAITLVIPGNFKQLVSFFGLAAYFFYGMVGVGLIRLRYTQPNLDRPYKVWGYPATPIALVLFSAFLVVNGLVASPGPSLLALGFICMSLPVYYFYFRHQRAKLLGEDREDGVGEGFAADSIPLAMMTPRSPEDAGDRDDGEEPVATSGAYDMSGVSERRRGSFSS